MEDRFDDQQADDAIEAVPAGVSDAADSPGLVLPEDVVSAEDGDDGAWADDTWSDEDAEEPVQPIRRDPVATGLLVLAISMVVVLLLSTAGLFFYLSTLNKAPRNEYERSQQVFETAVAENPKDANSWIGLALAESEAGNVEQALDVLERGEKATRSKGFSSTRGDVLRKAKRYKEAIEAYSDAIEETDELKKRADAERAKVGVSLPIASDNYQHIYYGRAVCRKETGDLEGAVKDLLKALEAAPRITNSSLLLAECYEELGEYEKAEAAYQDVLRFIPDSPEALDGLERLKKGK